MQSINLIKKYLVDSQIYVSLMGTLLALFFMLEQNEVNTTSLLLIFITFFSGYLYTKYQYSHFFKKILLFNFLSGIICLILLYIYFDLDYFLRWTLIVIFGLLYDSSFLTKYIRKIPLLKVFYVGLTWALVNSWLILPEFHLSIFLISWLFITALVLPFDIRDMKDDQVVTFPKIIGVQNTKYLAYLLVFIATTLAVFFLKPLFAEAFFITAVITFILIYFSENHNQESYFSFWVETCSGLPFLFFILLKYF